MACSSASTATTSKEEKREQRLIDAMFLCDEWKSSKGGLSTFNRELAINLAETTTGSLNIHCYVSRSDDQDREDAKQYGVNLITAQTVPGSRDPLDWLKVPPPELPNPHIVIGHGRKLGIPACLIVRTTRCKWIQYVHVFCEDLGKFKESTATTVTDTIEENEEKHKMEIELCKAADAVVAVGSRLQQKYRRCLPDVKVEIITPGIIERFCNESIESGEHAGVLSRMSNDTFMKTFNVFMFGRATFEDLTLKGYDIVANAIGSLGERFELTFVGSSPGDYRNVEQWFLQKTRIKRKQITIRGYCTEQNELKGMFRQSDLVALPSRTEGFGLVGLEAISCGVPVLVSGESGIAEALQKVKGGNTVIVGSDEDEWERRISEVSSQSPEERQTHVRQLRENYRKVYSWRMECERFKGLIEHVVTTANDAELNIKVVVGDLKAEEKNMQTDMLAIESVRWQEVQQHRVSATSAASGSVSYPQTEDFKASKERDFQLIFHDCYHSTKPQSIEEWNWFREHLKEMRVIITGVSNGSLVITVKCESLMIMEELWTDYSSGHLGEVVQNCFVTEKILKELNLAELRLKTTMDIEEYNACKMFFEKDALRGAISSEFHSISSTRESPQKKEQWVKSEQKTKIMETVELEGTSALTVVPTTGHKKGLEEPWGSKAQMASAVAPSFRSTIGTTNYARLCRLLVDVSAHILRETFDIKRPPGNLHTVLSSPPVHTVLQSLRKKRTLSPSQWGKLYPAIKSTVSSRNFDITLLMVLLRNICGLIRPATGWDTLPPAADTTLEAEIVRIKCYRNTVYGHANEASVDDPTFNQYWQDIQDALVRLGGAGYQSAIDDLKKDCMDPDIEEHYKELLKQWVVDEVGIKERLDEIGKRLDELEEAMVNPKKRAGDKDALSSEFHSTSSTSESPQKKEQWEKSEQKTKIMETVKLGGTSALTVVPTTGHGKELEEPWGRKGMLPLPESSTFDPEEELEEPPMKLQRKEEFSTRNNKISVRRSKITEEGGVLMAQNVPSRVMIPPKAVPTCTEVTCFLWNLQILSPPLGRNEALVSSVMELACGSIPGTEKRYEFNVKVKLALSHSASDIKGYELVIKELIDEKTNDWRDLETRWAWTPSDIKDEHSGVEEFPDWLFPFAEAEITSFSSFAVVWRLKSFTFKNPSTLSSSFPCILSDHPGVSVTFPESSLPTGQTFALTIKVQEVPCSNAKLKERLVAGPILHISPSKPVQLLAPAWLTIPVILGEDIPKCLDYSATDVRIFCRTSEEDEREWNEVTEQLENIAVLENGTVTFTLNHFSEYWVWIDPLKRSFATLKNLANDLYRKLMLQQVGLFARLYARGNPPNYVLTLCCFPLHLKEQVYTPLSPVPRNVCAQGGGNSLKPLCKADRISVSLSKAFTLMQEENLDNFLTFLGTEPFERSLPVSITDLNNLQVELYMGNQYYRETLCTLYFVPTVPDQTSSLRNLPSTAQVALEFSTAFPSPKALEETDSSISSKKVLKVAILADEWNSLKGGLSTFNRELAIHLASCSGTQVTFLVPHGACGMEEKAAAAKNCVTIIEPKKLIASPPPVELFFPPKDLRIDVIIGHGVKLGQQAQIIRESHDCKWVQVVHTAPDELGMHKDCAEAIAQSEEKNQREVSLCEIADLVMAVGPKLKGFYSNHLRSFNKDQNVVEFTPGIMRDLIDVQQSLNENDVFQVLIFGRGDDEDFKLKGYDIAAGAFASHELKNDSYHLTFVGAAPGKQDEFAAKILQHGISKNQLSVKEYIKDRNRLKELLLRMDLVIMPSRTEGFGLTALEALSAGLPVLAGHNSGFSNALQKVGFGELCVINSDKPEDWSKAIKKVRKKERNKRLDEMQQLRKSYGQKYNWAEQCEILVKEMRRKVFA